MSELVRALKLYEEQGLLALLTGLQRYVYWNTKLSPLIHRIQFSLMGPTVGHSINGKELFLKADNASEYARIRTLYNERRIIDDLLDTLEPDDVFYDVGANIGIYSCFAAKATGCEVVAFEPHPANIPSFRRNMSLNGIDITLYEVALWDQAGAESLSGTEGDVSGIGSAAIYGNEGGGGFRVETAITDRFIANNDIPVPNVIKIDIEGGEGRAMTGMENILGDDSCRVVYCEVHPEKLRRYNDEVEVVENLLQRSGFELDIIGHRSNEYFIKACK